jgi:hypothetical protein
MLKAEYSLHLSITNAHPEERGVSTQRVETYVLTIPSDSRTLLRPVPSTFGIED